jgi:hypothetical protein
MRGEVTQKVGFLREARLANTATNNKIAQKNNKKKFYHV